jgi:hypothetical protein
MAWEWVAPTASASAGSIAVFFTWPATKGDGTPKR